MGEAGRSIVEERYSRDKFFWQAIDSSYYSIVTYSTWTWRVECYESKERELLIKSSARVFYSAYFIAPNIR